MPLDKDETLMVFLALDDNTNLSGELACAGGSCEIDVDLKKLEEVSETQI